MFRGGFPFQPRTHAVRVDPSLVHTLSECVSTRRDDSARMSTSSIQTYNNNENISKGGDTKTPVNSKSDEKSTFPVESIISLDDKFEAQI